MKHIYLDYETMYSSADYSLSKMTTQEYITDPRFEVIGCGIKWDDASEPEWCTDMALSNAMDHLRGMQDECVVYAHNCVFDGSILSWMYGVRPAILVDTISVARVLGLQSTVGGSLAKLAEQMQKAGYTVPPKGTEVVRADGKRRKDFSDAELAAYGEYCKTDVKLLHALAQALLPLLPIDELMWQSTVLKMYTEPMLRVNHDTVAAELQRVKDKREASKQRLAQALGVSDINMLVSVLNSNQKFAEALQLFGAEAPMKISKATGKPTFALGIKDEEFLALQEHPIPEVRELVVARMGLKSSIEESRCEQFLALAAFEQMPAPYKVSGARTHRLGGCLTSDTIVTCLQNDGCIVEKAIVDVLLSDLVWDGQEFCEHEGVVYSGYQEVITHDGITGTPDHRVFVTDADAISLAEAKRTGARILAPRPPAGRLADT